MRPDMAAAVSGALAAGLASGGASPAGSPGFEWTPSQPAPGSKRARKEASPATPTRPGSAAEGDDAVATPLLPPGPAAHRPSPGEAAFEGGLGLGERFGALERRPSGVPMEGVGLQAFGSVQAVQLSVTVTEAPAVDVEVLAAHVRGQEAAAWEGRLAAAAAELESEREGAAMVAASLEAERDGVAAELAAERARAAEVRAHLEEELARARVVAEEAEALRASALAALNVEVGALAALAEERAALSRALEGERAAREGLATQLTAADARAEELRAHYEGRLAAVTAQLDSANEGLASLQVRPGTSAHRRTVPPSPRPLHSMRVRMPLCVAECAHGPHAPSLLSAASRRRATTTSCCCAWARRATRSAAWRTCCVAWAPTPSPCWRPSRLSTRPWALPAASRRTSRRRRAGRRRRVGRSRAGRSLARRRA
jgi:hypothetical protein